MPIYEYECLACAHRFDEIQKFSDPPKEICPLCSAKVRKLIFPAAVIFKGSGFYATEYGKSKHSVSGTSVAPDESKSKKTEGSSESKSETKSETKSEGSTEKKSETKSESSSSSATPAPAKPQS